MKHVDMLKKDWAKYCGSSYKKYRDKIEALNKRIEELRIERGVCVENHEYNDVETKDEEIEIVKAQLEECSPINFDKYVKREFAKDFKTIVGTGKLTKEDRLFFKIYFFREYLGLNVNDVVKKLKIGPKKYYDTYNLGMGFFFPGDNNEVLSEVG
jgi:hypothetical protein